MTMPNDTRMEEKERAEARRKRQERKKAQQKAMKTGVWDKCLYRVPGRERYCAQSRSPHSDEYCGTHMGASPCAKKGKRVPCPVDPNHTVFEQQLSAHVKICNLALQEERLRRQPYFSKDINSGPADREVEGRGGEGDGGCDTCAGGGRMAQTEGTSGAEGNAAPLDEAFVLDVIARVSSMYRRHVGELPTNTLDPPEVQSLHRARVEGGTGFRKGRHILQQASIVGHMIKRGLVDPGQSNMYVEMGAGRGALGLAVATAFPGADITMVERSSVRRKAENRLEGVTTRARIDIRDLNMAGLPSLLRDGNLRPIVAVAKHLCGVATDLALRAMLTVPMSQNAPPAESATISRENSGCRGDVERPTAAVNERVGGVAIATCCHHLCSWRDYTGKDFLSRLGFTAREFEVMRRVSAWISLEPEAGTRKINNYPTSPSCRNIQQSTASATGVGSEDSGNSPGASAMLASKTGSLTRKEVDAGKGVAVVRGELEGIACGGDSERESVVDGHDCKEEIDASIYPAESKGPKAEVDRAHHKDGQDHDQDGVEAHHSRGGEDGPGLFPALSATEKARAARECKRLLDHGRKAFLEDRLGLRSEVVHFVEKEITPENALLLAFR